MRRAAVASLAVLVLALATVTGVLWLDLRAMRGGETAGAEAMAAAKAVAPDLLSYDYRTIEQDLARAAGHTTGALTSHYKELSGTLVAKAKAERTVQTTSVAAVAVERAEPGRVEVLMFVNTGTVKKIAGKAEPQQQVSQNRARFVMIEQGSRWLVADLSTLIGTA
ncbi:hypothetical protein LDL08_27805 [Nonomuraea glycinis]|uniref:Mce-associated membrane protein n=1 Tax=Nonomuraea glycinis TaxID=2047744 RepID=A0A918E7T1_9ACTN|nr:hypothetical protein [Nonomuraea glycinis]MCA2179992.1 hypothetical protein [Nonomuraea glycinis]WSG71439.1 hypothetical protein OHA68_18875 [Nonomuraea glycinis]GGP10660.1 hypothetical protein GCM10012278_51180 [Nonomuraea glycinis]